MENTKKIKPGRRGVFDKQDNLMKAAKIISENPDNLQRAFDIIANEFNLSSKSITNMYYRDYCYANGKKRVNHHPLYRYGDKLGVCFVTIGKHIMVNGKNNAKNISLPKVESFWGRVKTILKSFKL